MIIVCGQISPTLVSDSISPPKQCVWGKPVELEKKHGTWKKNNCNLKTLRKNGEKIFKFSIWSKR